MAEASGDKFDVKIVHDHFLTSLHETDDVILQSYLDSYRELYKFFQLMGSVFAFVSSDVKQKIEILTAHINRDDSNNFQTVKIMLMHEKDNDLLEKKDYVSGSRTLLRLHRGLDFIREFLRSLGELKDTDKTGPACQEAYDGTLAKYHPWLVRKGARVAMYALPTRDQLLRKVCGNEQEIQKAKDLLPKMLEITRDVYERVEALYTLHDLHYLP